jgi:dolichol kinase
MAVKLCILSVLLPYQSALRPLMIADVAAKPAHSSAATAPLIAAAVPGLNVLRLLLVGAGVWQQPALVASVSRSTNRRELLRGPLIYAVVLVATTLLSWRDGLPGVCVVAMMCGGDGVADMVGRRWGDAKLPWNTRKSWAGSAAMLAAGAGLACMCAVEPLPCSRSSLPSRCAAIAHVWEHAMHHVMCQARRCLRSVRGNKRKPAEARLTRIASDA